MTFPTFNLDKSRIALIPNFLKIVVSSVKTTIKRFVETFVSQQARASTTSGSPSRKSISLLTFQFPLPPPTEQRRIVARIEALAAKIEEAQLIRGEVIEEADRTVSSKARKILGTIIEPVTELEKWLDSLP